MHICEFKTRGLTQRAKTSPYDTHLFLIMADSCHSFFRPPSFGTFQSKPASFDRREKGHLSPGKQWPLGLFVRLFVSRIPDRAGSVLSDQLVQQTSPAPTRSKLNWSACRPVSSSLAMVEGQSKPSRSTPSHE